MTATEPAARDAKAADMSPQPAPGATPPRTQLIGAAVGLALVAVIFMRSKADAE
ncbi:hypothetical protein [Streptomyces sp. NRRL B-24572]|uniref:hypothetical protein n=1 Tax=Streptomyces sp. NRRL B-24572 TaxID=1962156 RepID=UPI00211B5B46|nr:hypothetical protein [Streptomyces sp. NRRL B-24572]